MACRSGRNGRPRDQFREFPEVPGGCGEEELVFSAVGSAEAKPVEPEDAFEVGEKHLDLLSSSIWQNQAKDAIFLIMEGWVATSGIFALLATTCVASAEGDPKNGKLLAGRCTVCHGDGNARSTSFQVVPMLAGQPASYLVKEMQNYATGSREDTSRNARMSSILQSLTSQDVEDIAAYFAAQPRY